LGWVGLGWVGLAQEQPLAGVIDIHVYSAPNSTPRSLMRLVWLGWRRPRECAGWSPGLPQRRFSPLTDFPLQIFSLSDLAI
jgi:hypothetical protein